MRIGVVASVRLSPTDTMSAVDIVTQAKAFFPGMSISGAVALAVSIAFETLRKQGSIPVREGFEYASMVEPFSQKKNTKIKRAFADQMYNKMVAGEAVALAAPAPDYAGLTEEQIIQRQMEELEKEGR